MVLSLKNYFGVGWVEERNPTFSGLCWVSRPSTQPTNFLNRIVLGGYGIVWNEEIDLSEYELWKNGVSLMESQDKAGDRKQPS
ncbi:hypothetical protein IQ276_005215 [Desmonostoc muscorum LEGE 12446]|uniref:DUF2442 domain-containing protein n=1 Tax=Desmonostoc muscorum LEGE 12446 TaxID=1828758 RepID=A0A8J6ZJX1_DESMC|nr:hypothetical protein [Desmonostoc muscorum LEGE 12446]